MIETLQIFVKRELFLQRLVSKPLVSELICKMLVEIRLDIGLEWMG